MNTTDSTLQPLSDAVAQAETLLDQVKGAMESLDKATDRRRAFAANHKISVYIDSLSRLIQGAAILRHGGAVLRFDRAEAAYCVGWIGRLLQSDISGVPWRDDDALAVEERVLYAATVGVSLDALRHEWGVEDPLSVVEGLIGKGSALYVDLEHNRSGVIDEERSRVTFAPYLAGV